MVYSDYFIIVGPLPKYFDIFHFTHTVPQKHSSNSVRSCMPNANYGSLQARSQSFLAATNTPLFLVSEIRFGSRLFPRIWRALKMFGGATLSILDVPPRLPRTYPSSAAASALLVFWNKLGSLVLATWHPSKRTGFRSERC